MKAAYLAKGFDGEPDHRLLEMLLFFGIPYRDTNEIAHQLLNRFGSFSRVFHATPAQLKQVKGMTENAAILISMLLPLYQRYEDDLLAKRPLLDTAQAIVEFIRPKYLGAKNERVYVLCLDKDSRLVSMRVVSEGDCCNVQLDLRQLASAVLESNVSNVVLVHNHPNEITAPSKADIRATELAFWLLQTMKVRLEDHVIVSKSSYFSMVNSEKFQCIFSGVNHFFDE